MITCVVVFVVAFGGMFAGLAIQKPEFVLDKDKNVNYAAVSSASAMFAVALTALAIVIYGYIYKNVNMYVSTVSLFVAVTIISYMSMFAANFPVKDARTFDAKKEFDMTMAWVYSIVIGIIIAAIQFTVIKLSGKKGEMLAVPSSSCFPEFDADKVKQSYKMAFPK